MEGVFWVCLCVQEQKRGGGGSDSTLTPFPSQVGVGVIGQEVVRVQQKLIEKGREAASHAVHSQFSEDEQVSRLPGTDPCCWPTRPSSVLIAAALVFLTLT